MVRQMVNPNAPHRSSDEAGQSADEAIATVLRAETDARAAITRAHAEAAHIAEAARAQARALAERTERRIRRVTAAFEQERAERLAELGAEAAAVAVSQVLTPDELARLDRAVHALARELTGGAP